MKTTAPVHSSPWARPSGANAGLTSRVATQTVRNWKGLGKGIAIAAAVITLAIGAGYVAAQPFDAAPPVAVIDAAPSSPDAAPGPVVVGPDPVTDPVGFGEKVIAMYRSGSLVPASILLLFGLVLFLHKRLGWFSKGRAALYVAAGIAGLTMLAEAASRGTTPNAGMFVAAIAMVVGMVLDTALGKGKGG